MDIAIGLIEGDVPVEPVEPAAIDGDVVVVPAIGCRVGAPVVPDVVLALVHRAEVEENLGGAGGEAVRDLFPTAAGDVVESHVEGWFARLVGVQIYVVDVMECPIDLDLKVGVAVDVADVLVHCHREVPGLGFGVRRPLRSRARVDLAAVLVDVEVEVVPLPDD